MVSSIALNNRIEIIFEEWDGYKVEDGPSPRWSFKEESDSNFVLSQELKNIWLNYNGKIIGNRVS